MVSKKEQIADLEAQLAMAKEHGDFIERKYAAALRDNSVHRERESARMRTEHAEQQWKLKEAERQKRREHLTELAQGIVRVGDAVSAGVVSNDEGTRLKLEFRLDADEARIVGDNLRHGRPRIGEHVNEREGQRITAAYTDEWAERMQDAINKARVSVQRARAAYGF